jgi:hypothetical protein
VYALYSDYIPLTERLASVVVSGNLVAITIGHMSTSCGSQVACGSFEQLMLLAEENISPVLTYGLHMKDVLRGRTAFVV